jgi:IPT/TIG domain/Abnormal spindle-like microcephaly-assoc'd, ASPM-SPD-2-Hydin/Fibronectin type III domain
MNNSSSHQNGSKAGLSRLAQRFVVTLACLLCPAGLFAAPTFVQENFATPQVPTATVPVAYTTAQTAGDLNVVVVGWNDTTATVQSVKDSAGNTYSLAIGPTSGTALRQSIYYAPNILAGANTVTVTFSQAAAYPDIRILEYRGVNAVDVTAGAVGNSAAANSGAATTTVASELVFGADMVQTTTASAGSGFTSRVITAQDGDIAEDKVVTATGSNSATATLTSAGPWVMQMVTFFALSGPAPTVASVSPNSGTTAGGTAVTITGANFVTGATVTFGSAAATSVVVVSGTQITATTPAGSAGAVLVTVSNPGGQSGALAGGFTYIAPPTVTSVSPNNGPVAGGTAVTITGTNFATGATVTLGGTVATNVVVASSTTITATTPAHVAGAVTATVTNSNGLSGNLANGFTYVAPPTVTGVSPSSGTTAGGTAVTISGTNFATGAGVTFGSAAATNVVVVSSTTITATTPAGSAGAVAVTVTNPGSLSGSLASGYTYVVTPTVTSVSPNNGPPAGGTSVTITGTNFASGATVTFGSAAATNVVVVSATQITATTPAGGGVVTVTVTANGQSGTLANGFTYNGAPTAPGGLTAGKGSVPTVVSVQSYDNSTFMTTHTTAAFNSTGGDLIVLCASSHFGVTFTPSDNLGNTWISIAGPTTTPLGFDLRSQIWYAPNPIVGSAQTVTMNLSQSMPLVMSIIVVKGSNTSSPIDAISLIGSDNGTQSLNVTSPTIATAGTNDLLIGFSKVSAGATFQPGTGFTQQAAASSNFLDAETGAATTPGNYTATFTIDSAQTWEAAVVAVSSSPNRASLSWTASTETGGTISEYLVERCQGTGCTSFAQVGTTTNTSYSDTGLTASTSYSYRVRAQDTNGNDGPYSTVVTLTTPAAIPSLPGNLTATSPSSTTIDLSWTASTETGGTVNDYNVQRCAGANCVNFVQIGTSSGTIYNDTGLTNGTTYTYRVQAVDAQDNLSPYSNLASATAATPDTQPPTAPTNLTATAAGTSQINLSWTASTDNVGVTGYFIERCTGAGCTTFFRIAVSTVTTYSDTNLSTDTTYEYRVRATDAAGNLSGYSNIISGTTLTSGSPDFTLSASPGSLSVAPGGQVSSTITSTLSNGFSSAVSLTASGMPSGTTVSFNPTTIAAPGGGTSTMTVTVGSGTPIGSYTITVTGNGGGIQQTTTVPLTVGTSLITYVQGNYATPQASQTSVPVKFNAAQAAGDLNVVAVGWNDSTASVSAVTDTSGNTYTLAEGPTSISGVASQSIYYAKNIAAAAAGANTVTVTFSTAAKYPDIRILEYNGADQVNPVDVTSASTGNSASSSSGSVNTTNSLDLLFGADLVQTSTTGAGAGFTSRLLTSPDADIAEDSMVTATGSYAATAPVSPASQWIMQMVAFRTPPGVRTPVVSLGSTSLNFGSVTTGTSSSSQPVTLTNTGSAVLTISSIAILNGNTGDFSQTNNCGSTLAPNGACTINVSFAPTDTGARGASVAINDNSPGSPQMISLSGTGTGFGVTPRSAVLTFNMTQQFTASGSVTWSVDGVAGGSSTTGTISSNGLYTPPASIGTHTVTATTGGNQASSTVYISNYPGTYTFHNDNLRTGQNTAETVLTPANVNPIQFGKLFSYSIDGIAFASPLYVAGVTIPSNGIHNVVYVATENDSVYAFDADGLSSTPLWHVNFLKSGVTTVPCADVGECGDIPVQIGITSTPIIDPTSGTIYVVAKTKESSTYVQRLHALDITTGAEKFGGPVVLTASVPGTGVDSSGGKETFNSLRENQRTGLLLSNGVIYFAFGSHGDNSPWHGWVLGYNASTLKQVLAFNATPNGGFGGGGIWQCGGGIATDSAGNMYFTTSNGDFDVNTGGVDYGDTIVKLSPSGSVLDYFTPYDQANLSANNLDFGSAGPVLLVDQAGGPYPHLLISAGKSGTIYVINRDNMGQYNPNNDNQVVQALVGALPNGDQEVGNYSAPVYFNGHVYFAAVNDTLRAFQLNNGLLSAAPTSQSAAIYPLRGGAFAVSSNGNNNGILWAIQTNGASPNNPNSPGVLFAYDATNLADELYDSNESGSRDTLDFAAKFSIPLVANGKVFVGSQSELTAYGLLP